MGRSSSSALAVLKLVVASASLMCIILVVSPYTAEAGGVTCQSVNNNVGPCISYLMGNANAPSKQCCSGIKTLRGMASTPADRKTACNCLKSAAARINNMNFGKAAGLPRRCGVTISYAISPRTDCSRVR